MASIHPEPRATARARTLLARERYANATKSERVGMFNPDAKPRKPQEDSK